MTRSIFAGVEFLQLLQVLGSLLGQDGPEDQRMQGFDPAVEDLGKIRDAGHFA